MFIIFIDSLIFTPSGADTLHSMIWCISKFFQFFKQHSEEYSPLFGDLFDEGVRSRHPSRGSNQYSLTLSSGNSLRYRLPFENSKDSGIETPKMIRSSSGLKNIGSAGEKKFVFEYPDKPQAKTRERKLRGYGRMNSCPDNIVMKPSTEMKGKGGRYVKATTRGPLR